MQYMNNLLACKARFFHWLELRRQVDLPLHLLLTD